eukprot:NODE_455_length_7230_cov_0.733277.p1 type:complete len:871 gc:universal NODE_455_length_7230_cov_0.733277:3698-1086(-)
MSNFASSIEGAVDRYFNKNQKYFKSKKGENFELKNDLNSEYKSIRKEAVKRVIASMTVGKNVSELFADVLKCMQTDDLELKKLVYLYLMNYAKTQPELVILAVNTFVKDAEDLNPLIRALAIRTMGCLRSEKIVDYLFEPLRKGLQDPDPYVRKTAAMCVAKMYDLSPSQCVEFGFVETVENLLQDENPMVIANAIASLHEMRSKSKAKNIEVVNLNINSQALSKLLNALNECTEWGQIVIMESLCDYHTIANTEEATIISEKVSARLQHQNPSVVLTAIRLIIISLLFLQKDTSQKEFTDNMLKKLKGPLVTLLSTNVPELIFSFLRNMHVIVEQFPTLLNGDLRPFFVKYNDPPYVKLEKLSLLRKLANDESIESVLTELKEYASEVDIEFVGEAIYSFECIALKFPNTSERCVNALLELLKTKIDYVCSDSIKALRNIIRKYPGQFDKSVEFIAPYLRQTDGLSGKEAVVWLIGEFPGFVNGIYDVLENLLSGFVEEPNASVQLAILVAIVKCFLKRPNDPKIQGFLQTVLESATEKCQHPDIRDRAFIYWRLLSVNPEKTREIVWTKKDKIDETAEQWKVDPIFLKDIIMELSTLVSLFHVRKTEFLANDAAPIRQISTQFDDDNDQNLLDLDLPPPSDSQKAASGGVLDLLESFGPGPVASEILSPSTSPVQNAGRRSSLKVLDQQLTLKPLISENGANGMGVAYKYHRNNDSVYLRLQFKNSSNQAFSDFAIQFNKNSFGIVPAALLDINQVQPQQSATVDLPLTFHPESMYQPTQPFPSVQIAIKNNLGVYFGESKVPFTVATFEPQLQAEKLWDEIVKNTALQTVQFEEPCKHSIQKLQEILAATQLATFVKNNVYFHSFRL